MIWRWALVIVGVGGTVVRGVLDPWQAYYWADIAASRLRVMLEVSCQELRCCCCS